MPRKLDKKVIQGRIKENKALMRSHKVALMSAIQFVAQGIDVSQKQARSDLTSYMRAALAVTKDSAKLDQLKQEKDNA